MGIPTHTNEEVPTGATRLQRGKLPQSYRYMQRLRGSECCDICSFWTCACDKELMRKHKRRHAQLRSQPYRQRRVSSPRITITSPNGQPARWKGDEAKVTDRKVRIMRCGVCGKRFGFKSVLLAHIVTNHDPARNVPRNQRHCRICHRRFPKRPEYDAHILSEHSDVRRALEELVQREPSGKEIRKFFTMHRS